ncbi:hypothetical protein J2X46_001284 [Nocardioides sp. BE266]|uniref:hypothetical protein n=1 Tax=Nocardioides sp. BE266 TaxID=2817725 RepID=UPI0028619E22|nr:hypothetical protein [Nocardioides sp. BE266]MDR7252308.1 hypothetical protein [Nocardioides sp. BE266]
MNANMLELLLIDLEEEFDFDRSLALYEVSWTLAGLGMDRSDPAFASLAREAYTLFRARHPELVLARGTWPDLVATARPVPEEGEVDLDPETTSDRSTPILLLVHPDDLPPAPGPTL